MNLIYVETNIAVENFSMIWYNIKSLIQNCNIMCNNQITDYSKEDCMNRKRWFFLITIIIIIVGYIILVQPKDDITKMEKQISKHIKAKQLVLIYNATYIDNHRYMSYIEGEGDKYQQVGYAHFLINNQGKYEHLDIIKPDKVIEKAKDIAIFELFKLNLEDYNILVNSDIFIISNNPDLAAIERVMNDGETQQKKVDKNPSISFFNEENENVIEYNFYNQDGVLIK